MSNAPITKFVSHIDLYSGWTFVSIPEDNIVLGIKNVVLKTFRICNTDGSQQVAQNGEKIYSMESQPVLKIFTNEEYQQMMKQSQVKV